MNILIPKYTDINSCCEKKKYNIEREYEGYIDFGTYKEDGIIFGIYWFLELIDIKHNIQLFSRRP